MFIGLILIFWGGVWLAQEFGFIPADLHIFWSILLIAIGISIMFKKRNTCLCDFWDKDDKK
ncbi:hypothetical protein COX95_01015 [bacterium CG_4_10_14_0_2_um_filter_33_32]|nr:MAG: hypothetical protein AUJ93_01115 [bacterium CG2_30_33_46]PIZ86557.1 MAG: hypothetical protein COX95_01015 [bacterium CG_4_10_14_0_2_um_filter_33_32]